MKNNFIDSGRILMTENFAMLNALDITRNCNQTIPSDIENPTNNCTSDKVLDLYISQNVSGLVTNVVSALKEYIKAGSTINLLDFFCQNQNSVINFSLETQRDINDVRRLAGLEEEIDFLICAGMVEGVCIN